MLDFTGYTNAECYRVNDTLPSHRIESLLDIEERYALADNAIADISEVASGFVDEGFLADVILRVESMAKSLRGANRLELLDIAEQILDIELNAVGSSGYASEKLDALKKSLTKGQQQ